MPSRPRPEPLLSVPEAAARLGITERALRGRIFRREIAVIKIGAQVRIDPADLESLIERGRRKPIRRRAS